MSIENLEEPEGDQDDKKHKHLGKPVLFSIYFRKIDGDKNVDL